MSKAVASWTVQCEQCAKRLEGGYRTVALAYAAAHRSGWTGLALDQKGDLCPVCSKASKPRAGGAS